MPRPVEGGRLIDTASTASSATRSTPASSWPPSVGAGHGQPRRRSLVAALLGVFFDLKSRREEAWLWRGLPRLRGLPAPRPQADPACLLTSRCAAVAAAQARTAAAAWAAYAVRLERSPPEAVHDRPPDPDAPARGWATIRSTPAASRSWSASKRRAATVDRIAVGREELHGREGAAVRQGRPRPRGRRRKEPEALTRPRPKVPCGAGPERVHDLQAGARGVVRPRRAGARAALPGVARRPGPPAGRSRPRWPRPRGLRAGAAAPGRRPGGRPSTRRRPGRATVEDEVDARPEPAHDVLARVGETRPNRLADGAAIGTPAARMRARATGWSGHAQARPSGGRR